MSEKTIETLIEDVENLLLEGIPDDVDDSVIDDFASNLALTIKNRLRREPREPTLRMSNIGKPCHRQLYYEINNPEDKEPLRPEVYLKFLYGDLIEELLLFLVRLSGHRVEGTQDVQEIAGIKGHRDCVIDGVTVDVKSASSFSFKKFKEGRLSEDDPFGYVEQLQSYIHSAENDPIVTDKSRGAFLVIDKTLGHICLDFHEKEEYDIVSAYEYKKKLVSAPEAPARKYEPVPDGKSGNMKLGMNCSYCDFKKKCWPEMRTFLYSYGPVHLVETVREPKVPEVIDGEVVTKD